MIEIRPLTTLAEMAQAEEVQRAAWQIDDLEVTSVHTLHALQHNGSPLLGAFDAEKLVGFCLGVLGTVDTPERRDQVAAARLKIYSVMAGVLPEYQGKGVGHRLKLAQREFALHIGVRLITWTCDPLESRNGYFNITKLGAVCQKYHVNFHGELSGINAGLPTDRFEMEWWVTSNRAVRRVEKPRRPLPLQMMLQSGALLVNEATFDKNGRPHPPANFVSRPTNLILVEIPSDFQEIKRNAAALAQRWRQHTRTLFTRLFRDGFLVTDFVHERGPEGHPRSFYLLTYQDA